MAATVYVLGTLVTLLCAVLLLRGYLRGHSRLLLWSALCFAALTISNALLFLDLILIHHINLYVWRLGSGALGMCLLLYGLIWESQ